MQPENTIKAPIFIVDQPSSEVEQLAYLLRESHLEVHIFNTTSAAYSGFLQTPPSLIFCEISLQPYDGLELFQKIRSHPINGDAAFILTSKQTELEEKLKYYQLDIDDYISKPFHPEEAACRIMTILQEIEPQYEHLFGEKYCGFSGNLQEMTILDLLQTLELGEKSAVIHLKRNYQEGRIYVVNGSVIDAELGQLDASAALEHMLGWLYGSFQLQIQKVTRKKTIERPARDIYQQGMKFQHLGKTLLEMLPPLSSIVMPNQSTKTNGFSEDEKRLIALIRKPMSIYEIFVTSHLNDLQTLSCLNDMLKKNVLQLSDQNILKSSTPPIERELVDHVIRARKKSKNLLESLAAFLKRTKNNKMKVIYNNENALSPYEINENSPQLVYLNRSDLMLIRQKLLG